MASSALHDEPFHIGPLLRGDAEITAGWVRRGSFEVTWRQLLTIVVGAGLFGAAMGFWRAPLQGLYAGIKLPLIVVVTASGNALLNAMFAPLLGLNLSLRQAFGAVLTSFSLACAILGAFSPIIAFAVWNLPPLEPGEGGATRMVHGMMMVAAVVVIAFGGITANLRLFGLLRALGGSAKAALSILLAWLSANLLLGSQVSWVLRPFVGAPGLEVRFMRHDAFEGSFFETFWASASGLFQ